MRTLSKYRMRTLNKHKARTMSTYEVCGAGEFPKRGWPYGLVGAMLVIARAGVRAIWSSCTPATKELPS